MVAQIENDSAYTDKVYLRIRIEIIGSVFWDLSHYGTWDGRPAAGAAEKDYEIVTSLGASC